jgi:hypothetical protein
MSTLREQLTEAMTARLAPQAGTGNGVSYALTARSEDLADVALVVVSPGLDERDDEIARLRERWEASQLHCHELIDRAETAEARLAEQEGRIAAVVQSITEEQAGRQAAEATVARMRDLLPHLDRVIQMTQGVVNAHAVEVMDGLVGAIRTALTEPAQGEVPL